MTTEPLRPAPDTKDWTFAATELCGECGYDPSVFPDSGLADALRASTSRWLLVLHRAGVRERPAPGVWSPLEYTCHVRDVHRVFAGRIALMLAGDGPTFPNWDQDAAAIAGRYWEADPAQVADDLAEAAEAAAIGYQGVSGDQWVRTGLRGNGSAFTISSLGHYHLHDVVHHLADVGA